MTHILTYTGRTFDYSNITKESVNINDIIYALPRLNRFVGHSSRAYSVAEHSIYCYRMAKKLGLSKRLQLLTLIHDFTEAYVGDCPAPLKNMLPKFSEIEAEVETAIYQKIGIPHITEEEHALVKQIDLTMLVLEMRDFTLHNHKEFIKESKLEGVIHEEFLSDESFNLKDYKFTENDIYHILKYYFEEAIQDMEVNQ